MILINLLPHREEKRQLRKQGFFLVHALQLPATQGAEHDRHQHCQQPTKNRRVLSRHDKLPPSR